MLLLLTEPRSAVCGYTVFLMIFTLVGFKAVPVRVLIITCVAKQRGSWKKAHMTSVSGFQLCPPGKKVSKALSLLGKCKVKSMLQMRLKVK